MPAWLHLRNTVIDVNLIIIDHFLLYRNLDKMRCVLIVNSFLNPLSKRFFSELDMFADDEDIAIAEAAAAASKSSLKDDSNHQLMRANENPNLTDNWDDAEG